MQMMTMMMMTRRKRTAPAPPATPMMTPTEDAPWMESAGAPAASQPSQVLSMASRMAIAASVCAEVNGPYSQFVEQYQFGPCCPP